MPVVHLLPQREVTTKKSYNSTKNKAPGASVICDIDFVSLAKRLLIYLLNPIVISAAVVTPD